MTSITDDDFLNKFRYLKIDPDKSDSDNESDDGKGMRRMLEPKRAVFTFGRFQPPTKGHEGLIQSIEEKSEKLEADPYVFVSLSQNALTDTQWKKAIPQIEKRNKYLTNKYNENPLSPDIKIEILNKMFPDTNIEFINGALITTEDGERIYSIQGVIKYLKEKKYNDIYFIVGSKRFEQFQELGFEKVFGITLIENKRFLDGDFPYDEKLYELGKLSVQDIEEITQADPANISGTKVRQLAASHAVMKEINRLTTPRQIYNAIEKNKHRINKDIHFRKFKELMSKKLQNHDLEYYIYLIKKGMGLNAFRAYDNQNPDLARKSTRKSGKGGRKRTRKKKKRRRRRTKKKRKKKHRRKRKTKKKY